MGRLESGRFRSGKPAEEFSARPGRRSRICRRDLSAVQRSLLESIAFRERGHIAAHCLRCRGAHRGAHRGGVDYAGDGDLRPRLNEFLGPERGARGLRDGPGWNFFQNCGRHPPKIPHARTVADFPGRAGKFDGANGNIRRAHKSLYFCRLDLLCLRRRRAFSNAKNRTGFAAPLSLLGLSLGSRHFRRWGSGPHGKYLARSPRPLLDWTLADSRGTSLPSPRSMAMTAARECKPPRRERRETNRCAGRPSRDWDQKSGSAREGPSPAKVSKGWAT